MNNATNTNFKNLTKAQQLYVESIREIGGTQLGYDLTKSNWTRKELVAVSLIRQGNDDVPNWIVKDHSRRVGRGIYAIPEVPVTTAVAPGHGNDGDDLADMVQVETDPSIQVQDDLVPIVEASL